MIAEPEHAHHLLDGIEDEPLNDQEQPKTSADKIADADLTLSAALVYHGEQLVYAGAAIREAFVIGRRPRAELQEQMKKAVADAGAAIDAFYARIAAILAEEKAARK